MDKDRGFIFICIFYFQVYIRFLFSFHLLSTLLLSTCTNYVSAAQVAPKRKAQGVKSNVYTMTFYV